MGSTAGVRVVECWRLGLRRGRKRGGGAGEREREGMVGRGEGRERGERWL